MIPTTELPIHIGPLTITYPAQTIAMPEVVITLSPVITVPVNTPFGSWPIDLDEMTPCTGILRWTA